jgi:hypothetical protein
MLASNADRPARLAPAAVSGAGQVFYESGGLTWVLDAPMEFVEAGSNAAAPR